MLRPSSAIDGLPGTVNFKGRMQPGRTWWNMNNSTDTTSQQDTQWEGTCYCNLCDLDLDNEASWRVHLEEFAHQKKYLKMMSKLGPHAFNTVHGDVLFGETKFYATFILKYARDSYSQFAMRCGIPNHFICRQTMEKVAEIGVQAYMDKYGDVPCKSHNSLFARMHNTAPVCGWYLNHSLKRVCHSQGWNLKENYESLNFKRLPEVPQSDNQRGDEETVPVAQGQQISLVGNVLPSRLQETSMDDLGNMQKSSMHDPSSSRPHTSVATSGGFPEDSRNMQNTSIPTVQSPGFSSAPHMPQPGAVAGMPIIAPGPRPWFGGMQGPYPGPGMGPRHLAGSMGSRARHMYGGQMPYGPRPMPGPGQVPGRMQGYGPPNAYPRMPPHPGGPMNNVIASNQFIINQMSKKMFDMMKTMQRMAEKKARAEEFEQERRRGRQRRRSRSRSSRSISPYRRSRSRERSLYEQRSMHHYRRSRSPDIRSRSRSPDIRSRSRSPDIRSRSRDYGNRSRSRHRRSRSRSRGHQRSRSPHHARSRTPQYSRSRSPHYSTSRTPYRSRSRSPYHARSKSPYRPKSRSSYDTGSRSPHHGRSRSRSRTKSNSPPSRSRSSYYKSRSPTPGSRSMSPEQEMPTDRRSEAYHKWYWKTMHKRARSSELKETSSHRSSVPHRSLSREPSRSSHHQEDVDLHTVDRGPSPADNDISAVDPHLRALTPDRSCGDYSDRRMDEPSIQQREMQANQDNPYAGRLEEDIVWGGIAGRRDQQLTPEEDLYRAAEGAPLEMESRSRTQLDYDRVSDLESISSDEFERSPRKLRQNQQLSRGYVEEQQFEGEMDPNMQAMILELQERTGVRDNAAIQQVLQVLRNSDPEFIEALGTLPPDTAHTVFSQAEHH